MPMFSRVPVLCTRCQAFGLLQQGSVCPICQGAGQFPRLILPLKIVAAVNLDPEPDASFKRMVVTLAQQTDDGRVVVRGVTDQGMGLVASLSAARFAETGNASFGELDVRWPR